MVEPTDAAGVDDDGLTLSPRALTRLVRLALLAVVALLSAVSPDPSASLLWAGLLAVAALPGLVAPHRQSVARVGLVAELVVIALAIGSPIGSGGTTTLPYLAAMTFGPAASAGLAEALVATAASVLTTGVAGAVAGRFERPGFAVPVVEWSLIAALVAAVGVAIHRLAARQAPSPEPEFAQAVRLLNQLRTIARQLPGTLDAGSIAERLLDELGRVVPMDRGAVLTGSGGGRLEALAQRGPDRVAWETSVDTDSPVAEAWASQQPQTASRSRDRDFAGRQGSALVLPLVTGVRTVGLVALEADRPAAYPQEAVAEAAEVAGEAALRLETALLFEEVRSLATVEERQRLAREIHDGVAQELVMVGYGIDNAIAELPPDGVAANETLRALRAEVTRVITELRLSLFELRSDVDRHGGLGSAIADYARTRGTSGGLRVHLSLDETNARLPAAVESELLRIAQEAVTNARKHAAATNLWVSCEVDPPYARIEVSDDGRGIEGPAITGRYGMSIMAERADRVRATLAVTPRRPRGTTVTVVLSAGSRRGSVSPQQEVRPDSVQ